MTSRSPHLAILGAGPVGLEAALAAAEQGLPFTVYEADDEVAGAVRSWGHVRLFSPWSLNASPRGRRYLEAAGQRVPDGDACPTGAELVHEYLEPLARLPEIAPHLRLGHRVMAIGRQGLLKHEAIGNGERAARPFRLLLENGDGRQWTEPATRVFDCTGTYGNPNHLGDGGIPAPGEEAAGDLIRRTLPDFDAEADAWRGRHVLLVGAGHSAQTAAEAFAERAVRPDWAGSRLTWALRGPTPGWTVDPEDPLPERARLLERANLLVAGASPAVTVLPSVVVDQVATTAGRLQVTLRDRNNATRTETFDRVLSLTGFVGDHSLYRQLQVHECYATSGPMKLAAALLGAGGGGDCLAQTSHGADTLVNPEPGFFILGSKSYGRNNTFLMRVGWQQVDEVMAQLAP